MNIKNRFFLLSFFLIFSSSLYAKNIKIDVDERLFGFEKILYSPASIVVLLKNNNLLISKLGKPIIISNEEINFQHFNLKIKFLGKVDKWYTYDTQFDYMLGSKLLHFNVPVKLKLDSSVVEIALLEFKNIPYPVSGIIQNALAQYTSIDKQEKIAGYLEILCADKIKCTSSNSFKTLLIDSFNNNKEVEIYREPGDVDSFSDILFFTSGFVAWLSIVLFFIIRRVIKKWKLR
jgi:hypothetical protein